MNNKSFYAGEVESANKKLKQDTGNRCFRWLILQKKKSNGTNAIMHHLFNIGNKEKSIAIKSNDQRLLLNVHWGDSPLAI